MKRILSTLLTFVFLLALCAAASAEVYTQPVAGYGFTVPEGWMAIDGEDVLSILAENQESADFSEMVTAALDQVKGMPVVLLYERDVDSPIFRNNINVTLQDLGQEAGIEELMPYADAFVEGIQSVFSDFTVSTPLTMAEIGPWEAVIMGGEYTLNGYQLALRQVRLIAGTYLYEITLTALADDVTPYEEVLGGLVASFFAP